MTKAKKPLQRARKVRKIVSTLPQRYDLLSRSPLRSRMRRSPRPLRPTGTVSGPPPGAVLLFSGDPAGVLAIFFCPARLTAPVSSVSAETRTRVISSRRQDRLVSSRRASQGRA